MRLSGVMKAGRRGYQKRVVFLQIYVDRSHDQVFYERHRMGLKIVQGRPLGASDFKTHHEAKTAPHAPPCERCGISVFNSFENAAHRQRLSPRLGTAIAKGTLQSDAGKILLTNVKSGHMEWWPYQGVDRASYFFEVLSCNI